MQLSPTQSRYLGIALLVAVAVLVAIGFWKTTPGRTGDLVAVKQRPAGIMGTECLLAAVVSRNHLQPAKPALANAEAVLRRIESQMSSWLADSPISELNRAPADQPVPLGHDLIVLLHRARQAQGQTGGAFDITCRPLVELWRRAAKDDRLPSDERIAAVREASNWEAVELGKTTVTKWLATAQVDLGGIAKGYAIDRALEAMKETGISGGLVDVGGDMACFGRPPKGERWVVDVRNPFGKGTMTRLLIPGGAVCTSGDYARYRTIAGRRYSHIVDPRSGLPVESVPSVTVFAPSATEADLWATALSVLGPGGLERLPAGVEAILIAGSKDEHKTYCTSGISKLLESPLPGEPVVGSR
jgi:thiamine biosynthesis lipoprotein